MKIKFTTRKNHVQEGFGLLEALAASLLSLLFVGIGANLVLTANLYKVKAKRNEVMDSLIRADIESIKYQSTKLQRTATKCAPITLGVGFAWELRGNVIGNPLASASNIKETTIKILGLNYILKRTIYLDGDPTKVLKDNPTINPNILPIGYSFAREKDLGETGNPPSEYDLAIQIIPNESLKCL